MIEAASRLFGSVSVKCDAVFEYDRSYGFNSKVIYPMPLIVQENKDGITHIENGNRKQQGIDSHSTAGLSTKPTLHRRHFLRVGRDSDDVQYRILVVNSEDSDSFVHSVYGFEATTDVGRVGIRKLLDRARSISSQLLIRTGGV